MGTLLTLVASLGLAFAQIVSQHSDSAAAQSYDSLNSLYAKRDTARFIALARTLSADSSRASRYYRGIAAAWSGRSAAAIALLRPLADSSVLEPAAQRDVLRVLTDLYARTRKYGDASSMYERELGRSDSVIRSLRTDVDSLRAEANKTPEILESISSPETTVPPEPSRIPAQVGFIALLFTLFLLPKGLQRFRIPSAITSLVLGAAATKLELFPNDPTLNLLSTLGIVALFLFAGLEIDGDELRENVRPLVLHAMIWTALATIVAVVIALAMGVHPRVAALLALALVTPSTGFILSSLSHSGLNPAEQRSVRIYAVGSELIALAVLFFILQSTSFHHLILAIGAMAGIVLVIPVAFRGFASIVAPYAPKSEFAFLLMVAIVCAYATRLLGVYYLVGAFLVGVAAQRYRSSHPAMTSEKMVDALESFGSVFIPFYFFHAGMGIVSDQLTLRAVVIGLSLLALLVPLRIAVVSIHRRVILGEAFPKSIRPASAMVPTLVFTLVLVEILQSRFSVTTEIAGGLVLYTVINTLLPGFVLRGQPADFADVEALPLEEGLREG